MSFLLTLSESALDNIVTLLPQYEKKIEEAAPIFEMNGKKLEEILKIVAHSQFSYDKSFHELKALESWLENIKEKKIAKLWKKYIEGYSKVLSSRDVQAYINGEKEIVELNEIIIEVTLLKNQFAAVIESIKQLGWMVGNITKLRIAEMQEAVL